MEPCLIDCLAFAWLIVTFDFFMFAYVVHDWT